MDNENVITQTPKEAVPMAQEKQNDQAKAQKARRLRDSARRGSRQWCANAVRRGYETDLRIKSVAGGDGADELKLLLMELAREGRR